MPLFGSKRNVLLAAGLAVFALGWGGGLLLGAVRPEPVDTPRDQTPQVVDADEFAPNDHAQSEKKGGSLLEQVFGLEDLEEERPGPRPSPPPARRPPTIPNPESAQPGSSSPNDQEKVELEGSGAESVVLEEDPPKPEAPATEPAPTEIAEPSLSAPAKGTPDKASILDENPYK